MNLQKFLHEMTLQVPLWDRETTCHENYAYGSIMTLTSLNGTKLASCLTLRSWFCWHVAHSTLGSSLVADVSLLVASEVTERFRFASYWAGMGLLYPPSCNDKWIHMNILCYGTIKAFYKYLLGTFNLNVFTWIFHIIGSSNEQKR